MFDLYKDFTLNKITEKQFSHIKLLLFWPVYGIMFLLLERVLPLEFTSIFCKTDAFIPFNEYFVIPYYMWFVYLIGMLLYTFFKEPGAFKKYMWFIIITYSITVVVYILYPSCQNLRPVSFVRDNVFTRIVSFLYSFDTNTNTCPSIHVLGMVGVLYASFNIKRFKHILWKAFFIISAVLVSASTVFLKQHSIIDIYIALILSAITLICMELYYKKQLKSKTEKENKDGCS